MLNEVGQTQHRLLLQDLLLSDLAYSKVQLVDSCLHPSLMHWDSRGNCNTAHRLSSAVGPAASGMTAACDN